MNNKLLDYLCCPTCKSDLLIDQKNLICSNCKKQYDIVNGIPVLVNLKNLPSHLSNQIKYFENESDHSSDYRIQEWQKRYVERFTHNFSQITDQLVIDCGTGSGYMTVELAKKGADIIACDLTLSSLLRLKNTVEALGINERVIIVCCSADQLPFKNSCADSFISNAVLEHLPDEKKTIRELNRVCKETACLMITVPLRFKYLNPLLIPLNYFHDRRIGHLRRYDEKKLLSLFNNWNNLKTYYTGHFGKVIKVLTNLIIPIFNEAGIEDADRLKESIPWGASNIIVMFNKKRL